MGHLSADDPEPKQDDGPARAPARDAAQEKDLWWGGYAARTLLPSFTVCGVLTLVIPVAAWYLAAWYLSPSNDEEPGLLHYLAYVLVGGVWLVQLLRLAYRLITYTYRLTTRRILCERSLV